MHADTTPKPDRTSTTARPAARTRAWLAFGAFAAGLLIAPHVPLDGTRLAPAGFALAGLCAAASLCTRRSVAKCAMLAAVLALGVAWHTHRIENAPPRALWSALDAQDVDGRGSLVRLRVMLIEPPTAPVDPDPIMTPGFRNDTSPRAAGRVIDGEGAVGALSRGHNVLVLLPSDADGLGAGTVIEGLGWMRAPQRPRNPGEPDRREWSAQAGDAGLFIIGEPEAVSPDELTVAQRARGAWWSWRSSLRERALRAAGDDATTGGRLVRAVLLGERDPRMDESRAAFARVGIAHLLAISGLHAGLFALILLRFLRGVRDLGRLESALVLAGLGLLLVLVPANPPVVRAVVLSSTLLATGAIGRRYDPATLLAWVAIGLLVWRPLDAASLGFQLSVGVTAVLLLVGTAQRGSPAARAIITLSDHATPRWREALANAFRVAVVCWLASLPVIASHTGIVSPLAWAVVVITAPLFAVLLGLGYAVVLVGLVAPPVAGVLSPITAWLGGLLAWAVETAELVPIATWQTAPWPAWLGVAGALLFACWMSPVRTRRPITLAALTGVVAALAIAISVRSGRVPHDQIRLDTFAVGDGTCHLLRSGSDAVLWDAGSLRSGLGRRVLPRAIHALGVGRVRTAIVTHANLDHYNALSDLFRPLGVERLLTTGSFLEAATADPESPEAELVRRAESHGVRIETLARGDTLEVGASLLNVLWPPPDNNWPDRRGISVNDTSLVARVSLGDASLLLTGDIQAQAIAGLVDLGEARRVTAIELPHHGSANPQATEFVRSLDPSVVVQSTGRSRAGDERWDHIRRGRTWFTTETDGAVSIILHADGRWEASSVARPEGAVSRTRSP